MKLAKAEALKAKAAVDQAAAIEEIKARLDQIEAGQVALLNEMRSLIAASTAKLPEAEAPTPKPASAKQK
jgi:hypothetical protein